MANRSNEPAWSGMPPANAEEARRRLTDAAVRCVQRIGHERTRLADVAAEAGVTRPTIYAYFGGREEILRAAMLHAADDLVDRLTEHVAGLTSAADTAVEILVFCLREVASHPGLAPLLTPSGAGFGSQAPLAPRGLTVAKRAVRPVIDRRPELEPEWDEVAEVMVRFFLSLITVKPPRRRNETELRSFLHRRLVAALHL